MEKFELPSHRKSGAIIALDADGVLLDYNTAYRHAWEKAFGKLPGLRDPDAYWALDRWHVHQLEGDALEKFRTCFDELYWESIPAIQNAVRACEELCEAGYELVCVTAVNPRFQSARLKNLKNHGFPIDRVIATSNVATGMSPKANALQELKPIAFVDDFLPYLRGIPNDIHAALVMREPNGSPNTGGELALAHSQHADLADFVSWWLSNLR